MAKLFSNFWTINVGHIVTAIVMIFGAGVAWDSVEKSQAQDRIASIARDDAIIASLNSAVSERNLKIGAIVDRLQKDEDILARVAGMDREVATLTAQMAALNQQLVEFRQELRSYQSARMAKASSGNYPEDNGRLGR